MRKSTGWASPTKKNKGMNAPSRFDRFKQPEHKNELKVDIKQNLKESKPSTKDVDKNSIAIIKPQKTSGFGFVKQSRTLKPEDFESSSDSEDELITPSSNDKLLAKTQIQEDHGDVSPMPVPNFAEKYNQFGLAVISEASKDSCGSSVFGYGKQKSLIALQRQISRAREKQS